MKKTSDKKTSIPKHEVERPAAYKSLGLSKMSLTYLDSTVAETNAGFELEWKVAKAPRSVLMLSKEGYVKMAPHPEHKNEMVEMPLTVAEQMEKMKHKAAAAHLPMAVHEFQACQTMFALPLKLYQETGGVMYWQMLDEQDKVDAATHLFVAARLNPDGIGGTSKTGVGDRLDVVPADVICYPMALLQSGVFDLYIFPCELVKNFKGFVERYSSNQRRRLKQVADDYDEYHRQLRRKMDYDVASRRRLGYKCDRIYDGVHSSY